MSTITGILQVIDSFRCLSNLISSRGECSGSLIAKVRRIEGRKFHEAILPPLAVRGHNYEVGRCNGVECGPEMLMFYTTSGKK